MSNSNVTMPVGNAVPIGRMSGGILSGLLRMLGIAPEKEKDLAAQIEEVAEKERMEFGREHAAMWAHLVADSNEIHLFPEVAKSLTIGGQSIYQDTPVYGTWIAARAEQYAVNLAKRINNLSGKTLVLSGMNLKFKQPLYPEKRADWNLERAMDCPGGINLAISAQSHGGQIINCPKLGLREHFSAVTVDKLAPFSGEVTQRKDFEILDYKLGAFYECLGKKSDSAIPMMYPASLIVSSLLDFSMRKVGKPLGIFGAVEYEFYAIPSFGRVDAAVVVGFPPRERKGIFQYNFKGLCTQNEKPLLYAEGIVHSNEKVESN